MEKAVATPNGMGVRELAREVELKVTTAQQLLKTLQLRGYLFFDPNTRRYYAGRSLSSISRYADECLPLRETLRPAIESFHQDIGETVAVQAMFGGEATLLLEYAARHPLTVRHGHTVVEDPHLWASGAVLLAGQSEATRSAYAQQRGWTKRQLNTFQKDIAAIQRDGIAVKIDVNSSGVAALGVPVVDGESQFVCALGCSIPLSRWQPKQEASLTKKLRATASQLTKLL